MTGKSPEGHRRYPALENRDCDFLGVGGSKYRRWATAHRHTLAAALVFGALVPFTAPAAHVGNAETGDIVQVAYTRAAVAPAPEALPSLQRAASPTAEVRKLDAAEETRKARIEAVKARIAAAKARIRAAKIAAMRPKFVKPAQGTFTSGFGARWGTSHNGIDIANSIGTPIVSVADGTVIEAGPASGFGMWVQVRHDDGTVTVYGHMYEFSVSEGQRVKAGEEIATIGNNGQSTGPHLHFEVWQDGGSKIDPRSWLAQRGVSV